MGDSQKQRCGFNLSHVFPSECGIRNGVLVTVKQLPVAAAGCTLTHVEQQGESGGIKERQRGSRGGPAADQLKVKLKRNGGRRRRRACGGRSSNESFMGLVTGHQSQASAPAPTHGSPLLGKNLSPILNNSLRSHSLPPEGLVSWRHQRGDLTAPERSEFFYPPASLHPPIHTHTHTHTHTHKIIPANSLIHASCSAVPPLG